MVVALLDIDQLRRIQQELRTARDFSRSVIQGIPLPLAVIDFDFRIRGTNSAFATLAQFSNGEMEGQLLTSITGPLWGLDQQLLEKLQKLRESHVVGDNFEFEHATSGEDSRSFCVRGCMLQPDEEQFLLVTFEDITAHAQAESRLKKDRERLEREVETTAQALRRSQEELRALTARLFTSQEEERRRIARELHDDVSQRLAALEMDSDQLESGISDSSVKEAIQRIRRQITTLAEDVRLMSHRLHPSIIEDLGLKPALRTLTEEFGAREEMIATFSSRNLPENVPIEVGTALYRIAQEALRNIAKHAGQTHVRVSLRGTDGGIQLQVADFGAGFDPSEDRSGLGLLSMEERARHIDAQFEAWSAPGEGTRITVTVPLARINQSENA